MTGFSQAQGDVLPPLPTSSAKISYGGVITEDVMYIHKTFQTA